MAGTAWGGPRFEPVMAGKLGGHVVLVPVKAFAQAKVRLAPALTRDQRSTLARQMADRVLAAARPLPVAVVCDDPEVAAWALGRGARLVWAPGRGARPRGGPGDGARPGGGPGDGARPGGGPASGALNRAVGIAVASLAAAGATRVTVAHADLPLATDLTWLGSLPLTCDPGGLPAGDDPTSPKMVTLVPDRHLDGTNVASVPTGRGFRFSYGPGSFLRHWTEALARGLAVEVVREPLLAFDVDQPGDLDQLDLTALTSASALPGASAMAGASGTAGASCGPRRRP